MTSAEKKLAWILDRLSEGRTVYITTALRSTAFKQRHKDMLRVKGDSLYMQRGKNWDCVDYCKISAV